MATIKDQLAIKAIYDAQSEESTTNTNIGAAAPGSVAVEYGNSTYHHVIINVNTTLGAIAGGAALGLGKKIYDLPAGAVIVSDAYMSIAITQTDGHINADTPKVGLGTVVASGAVSVLSGTATFQNILAGQSAANCTGTPTVKTVTGTPVVMEVGDAHSVYLNFAATWAASGDAAALVDGIVVLKYKFMH